MLMGIPLLVLYEISVIGVWIFGRKKLQYEHQEDESATNEAGES
jgi:Sec-independent protein secretion pathway component TatC